MTTIVTTNDQGRQVEVELPEHLGRLAPPMCAEAETLERIRVQRQATADALAKFASELERAEHDQGEKTVAAVLAGKALPAGDPTVAIREKIQIEEGRLDSIDVAIERQTQTMLDVLHEHRAELVETAIERRDSAGLELEAAVDAYASARATFAEALEDVRWLKGFPHARQTWRPSVEESIVVEAPISNGLLAGSALIEALTRDADPVNRRKQKVPGHAVPRRVREGHGQSKPTSLMSPEETIAHQRYEAGEIEFEELPESLRGRSQRIQAANG